MESIFANPSALWAGLLVGPLLLLYMLKHKPVRKRMPSVVLWQGAAQMQVSTSPFQRLRKSLSLILLLVALVAIVLAMAGLRIPGARARGTPVVLIVDVTASMAAREGGLSRLELARQRVHALLNSAADAPTTVLAWDGVVRTVVSNADAARARQAVDSLEVVHRGAADSALLRAVRRAATEQAGRRVVLITDHEPGTLEADVLLVLAGLPRDNSAIVAAALTEVSAGQQQLFFGLEHFGQSETGISVVIERESENGDSELIDVRELRLAPGVRSTVSMPVRQPGLYRARLRAADALELDDTAWVRYSELPRLDVALEGDVPAPLRRAIEAIQSATGSLQIVAAAGPATMYVYGKDPPARPPVLPAVYLLPGAAPPGVTIEAARPAAESPARTAHHALWRGAGVPDMRVQNVIPVSSTGVLTPLLETGPGPALALIRREGDSRLEDLLVCCPLDDEAGGFASRVAFVIFWENWFAAGRRLLDPLPRGSVSTSESTEVPFLSGRGPFSYTRQGEENIVESRPGESLRLDRAGVFQFASLEGPAPHSLGVSLLDRDESDLSLSSAAEYDEAKMAEALAAQDKSGQRADLPLYPWLLLLAAACVLFEWFWFRRNYPVAEPDRQRR